MTFLKILYMAELCVRWVSYEYVKIQHDMFAWNGESSVVFALPLFLAFTTVFKGKILLTNINFSLTYLRAGSSLRFPQRLSPLISPLLVSEKILNFAMALSSWLRPASTPCHGSSSLTASFWEQSQSHPLYFGEMKKNWVNYNIFQRNVFCWNTPLS